MAVFRIEKTKDYTVMSNHHLKNIKLSLKAKGLLSLMLSLPEDWDYTTKGLAKICKDGVDSISSTIKELEDAGYITRRRIRNKKGQLTTIEYIIREQPIMNSKENEHIYEITPKRENPILDKKTLNEPNHANPITENPIWENPILDNPSQLNTKELNTKESITKESIPIKSEKNKSQIEWIGKEKRERYKKIILNNIEYDLLQDNTEISNERLDEIVEIILDTVCTARKTIRVAANDYPSDIVKSRLLKLNHEHILYVFECLDKNSTYIRNIKQYLLTVLYNAPVTMNAYYDALVKHDLNT